MEPDLKWYSTYDVLEVKVDDQFKLRLESIGLGDAAQLVAAAKNYGDSWRKRGGVGAFMMLARKWDRLENAVDQQDYDIFETIAQDARAEGIMDDIRDLRRYLMLVEEFVTRDLKIPEVRKD